MACTGVSFIVRTAQDIIRCMLSSSCQSLAITWATRANRWTSLGLVDVGCACTERVDATRGEAVWDTGRQWPAVITVGERASTPCAVCANQLRCTTADECISRVPPPERCRGLPACHTITVTPSRNALHQTHETFGSSGVARSQRLGQRWSRGLGRIPRREYPGDSHGHHLFSYYFFISQRRYTQ